MCFSPSASFGASAVLTVVSITCMVRSRTMPQRVLSGIPLLFAIQQFVEGVVWLSLLRPEWAHWERMATYGFLFFAQMVWPVYVPLAVLLFERDAMKKK